MILRSFNLRKARRLNSERGMKSDLQNQNYQTLVKSFANCVSPFSVI